MKRLINFIYEQLRINEGEADMNMDAAPAPGPDTQAPDNTGEDDPTLDGSENDEVKQKGDTPLENFILDVKKVDLQKTVNFNIEGKNKFFVDYDEETKNDTENGILITLQDENEEKSQDEVKSLFKKMTEDKFAGVDNILFFYDDEFYKYDKLKETSKEINIYLKRQ